METRQLGKSDIKVTPIGLGAWQFSEGGLFNGGVWKTLTKEQTQEIIGTAIDKGINWIDTAEFYGFGRSERGVSAGLQANNIDAGKVVVATKWAPIMRFARNIRKNIDKRMANLSPYPVDLYQIHMPQSFSSIPKQMQAMADVVDAQKAKTIGISNFSASQTRKAYAALEARGYPVVSNQVRYTLMDREIESNGVLDAAKELQMTIIAYSPLEMGLLTGKFHDDPSIVERLPRMRRRMIRNRLNSAKPVVDLLKQIGAETNATPAQVALSWLTTFHGDTVVAIPGASKPTQAEYNAGSMSVSLSKEQLTVIDETTQAFL